MANILRKINNLLSERSSSRRALYAYFIIISKNEDEEDGEKIKIGWKKRDGKCTPLLKANNFLKCTVLGLKNGKRLHENGKCGYIGRVM